MAQLRPCDIRHGELRVAICQKYHDERDGHAPLATTITPNNNFYKKVHRDCVGKIFPSHKCYHRLSYREFMMSTEQEKICLMFDRIAGTYDSVNRVLSMGQDLRWRKVVADRVPLSQNLCVLDIATGTGDLLISMCQQRPNISKAHGVDLAEKMLAIGQKKISTLGLSSKIFLQKADAAKLPFLDATFDVVSISFGIRNFTAMTQALKEIARVLKPGGTLLILEFSLPKNVVIRSAYLIYFRHILPFLGGLISRDKNAYRYLNKTVENFPYSQAFCEILRRAGFREIHESPLAFGIATLYQGMA